MFTIGSAELPTVWTVPCFASQMQIHGYKCMFFALHLLCIVYVLIAVAIKIP